MRSVIRHFSLGSSRAQSKACAGIFTPISTVLSSKLAHMSILFSLSYLRYAYCRDGLNFGLLLFTYIRSKNFPCLMAVS